MKFFFFIILILYGCREFYDEEFIEFEKEQTRDTGDTSADVFYSADLNSTDPNLLALRGNVKIDIQNNAVNVDLDVLNIPANIIQLHYGYTNSACDQLSFSIPNENTTTRTYTLSEVTSVAALMNDLESSGASSGEGDFNLSEKSFVVKAFTNFSGIPTPDGLNQITILCGDIQISASGDDDFDTGTTPGTDGTSVGTTGETGTFTTTTTGF